MCSTGKIVHRIWYNFMCKHYNDITCAPWLLKTHQSRLFVQECFMQTAKKPIKLCIIGHLWGGSTSNGQIFIISVSYVRSDYMSWAWCYIWTHDTLINNSRERYEVGIATSFVYLRVNDLPNVKNPLGISQSSLIWMSGAWCRGYFPYRVSI